MNYKLPSLELDGYFLESGIQMHNEAPNTFQVPSDERKSRVRKGDIIKLVFQIKTANRDGEEIISSERMWVIVLERDGNWISGQLDNQPLCTDKIKPGLRLQFQQEHIIDIHGEPLDLSNKKFEEYQEELKKL